MTPFKVGDVIQWDKYPERWWGPIIEIEHDLHIIDSKGLSPGRGGFYLGKDPISLKYADEPVIEEDWS